MSRRGRSPLIRIVIAVATIAALGYAASAIAAGLPEGLNQLHAIPGNAATDGCISRFGGSEETAGTCIDGTSVDNSWDVTVSPDGKHVYSVKGTGSDPFDGVSAFSRAPATGVLTQLGLTDACTTGTGNTAFDGGGGTCGDGRALRDPRDIEVSSDGKHAYVAGSLHDAIALFDRDATTGDLDQLSGGVNGSDACISRAGSSEDGGATCATGIEMDGLLDLDLSPDGAHLYAVAPTDNSLLLFSRVAATGLLTQLTGGSGEDGCTSLVGIVGSCVDGRAVNSPTGVDVSPDGAHLYTASTGSDAVAVFSRNTSTGVLTQLAGTPGCVSIDGTSEEGSDCTNGRALEFPVDVEVSPGGENLYALNATSESIAIFDRSATTGALTQLAGTSGCLTSDASSEEGAGTCGLATFPDPTFLIDLEVSADGARV